MPCRNPLDEKFHLKRVGWPLPVFKNFCLKLIRLCSLELAVEVRHLVAAAPNRGEIRSAGFCFLKCNEVRKFVGKLVAVSISPASSLFDDLALSAARSIVAHLRPPRWNSFGTTAHLL